VSFDVGHLQQLYHHHYCYYLPVFGLHQNTHRKQSNRCRRAHSSRWPPKESLEGALSPLSVRFDAVPCYACVQRWWRNINSTLQNEAIERVITLSHASFQATTSLCHVPYCASRQLVPPRPSQSSIRLCRLKPASSCQPFFSLSIQRQLGYRLLNQQWPSLLHRRSF
jgi:hypothetical protein